MEVINEEFTSNPDSPKPRLQHIEPGQFFTLLDGSTHLLLRKSRYSGYVENGLFALSTELDRKNMVFGDRKGWRKACTMKKQLA